jgi:GntR family transcriptional regulator
MTTQRQLGIRRINKGIPIPYYYQIAEILRDTIEDAASESVQGEAALPSESEMCALYQVTRGTVRHALELLEREGLVYREKGRGTFMRRRRVQLDLTRLTSTTEDMQARGWVPGTRVLSIVATTRSHVQHQLRLGAEAPVWALHRLRLANNEPISLQWSYLPCERLPDLDQQDLTGSLYYTLKNVYEIELRTGEQIIRTRAATAEEGLLLQVPEGAPLFVIERTSYDQHGTPIEHLHSLWRGDRYDLHVRLFGV